MIRALTLELFLSVVRCFCDQLLEEMPGDVLTAAELFEKNRIILGALDHRQSAEFRKTCTVVRCNRTYNLSIPSSHQHIRYVLADDPSLRYCEEVRLAFRPGISNQSSSIEALGVAKYRTRNVDRIIEG